MPAEDLRAKIEAHQAEIAVIGLGYVGLALAGILGDTGYQVTGIERRWERTRAINRGECPIPEEPELPGLIGRLVSEGRLHATTDYDACYRAEIMLVAVETPVDAASHRPDHAPLTAALSSLGLRLRPGCLVIVESTLAPTTMAQVVRPTLEDVSGLRAGQDFWLAHCPERVMPGRLLHNLALMPRVVGGVTPADAAMAATLYQQFVMDAIIPTDCLTAEIVKCAENAYRDVGIAFANEVALICEALGANVWTVRELINTCPGREMLAPGAGVGGHCIPKDPWLLVAHALGVCPRVITAARARNDEMPVHVAEITLAALREAGVQATGATVAVLGYSYRESSADTRNTPTQALVRRLAEAGATVRIHDPYAKVPGFCGFCADVREAVTGADAVVLMVAHLDYVDINTHMLRAMVRTPILIDGRHLFRAEAARAAGFVYRCVGVGA